MCVCVCVCLKERKRGREREGAGWRERKKGRGGERERGCMHEPARGHDGGEIYLPCCLPTRYLSTVVIPR